MLLFNELFLLILVFVVFTFNHSLLVEVVVPFIFIMSVIVQQIFIPDASLHVFTHYMPLTYVPTQHIPHSTLL